MAMSNAERQADFRRRHLEEGGKARLELYVDAAAVMQLGRLARWQGTTLTAIVEQLAKQADSDMRASLSEAERRRYVRKEI